MAKERTRRHRLVRWVVVVVVVLVVLAVAVPFAYIHFIEGSAPPKLTLPKTTVGRGAQANVKARAGSPTASVAGTWHVGPGSVAGYRVDEVLIGQHTTAVGRTSEISGSLTISGTSVTGGSFTVNMASVKSDQSERNANFDGRIMDVARYPTATLRLTAPIDLGNVPAVGATARFGATGELTMHGTTRSVSFPVSAERLADGVDVLADVPITFADWNIANPSIGGFVTTANNGTLEVLLHLTQGPGNAAVSSGGGRGSVGGVPAPVTVPRTTVPPLKIPSGG